MAPKRPARRLRAAFLVLASALSSSVAAQAGGRAVAVTVGPPVPVLSPSPEFIPSLPSGPPPPGGITPSLPAPLPPRVIYVTPPVIVPLPDPVGASTRSRH